jgi:hypothetical protein
MGPRRAAALGDNDSLCPIPGVGAGECTQMPWSPLHFYHEARHRPADQILSLSCSTRSVVSSRRSTDTSAKRLSIRWLLPLPDAAIEQQRGYHATSSVARSAFFGGSSGTAPRCPGTQRHVLCTYAPPSAGTSTYCLPQTFRGSFHHGGFLARIHACQ